MADWATRENRSMLCDVSHAKHPLRTAAQGVVKELNLSGYVSKLALRRIFDAFAGRCSSLSLPGFWFVPDAWVTCRSLRKLKLERFCPSGIAQFRHLLGAQRTLEELDVQYGNACVLDAVADHGAGLKKLAFLGIDVREAEALRHMLRITGKSLRVRV